MIHAGHIRLFHFAKSRCDKLIVAVVASHEKHDLRDLDSRMKDLSAINLIDQTVVFENTNDLLIKYKPNFVFKGNEFRNKQNEEKSTIDLIGAELIFMSSDEKYDVRLKKNNYENSIKRYLSDYREKYNLTDLLINKNFTGLEI